MGQVIQFRVVLNLSKKSEALYALAQRQTRAYVPVNEFAEYRLQKMKHGRLFSLLIAEDESSAFVPTNVIKLEDQRNK